MLVNVSLVGDNSFGCSVSLSANGDTLAVGASSIGLGTVYIYTAPAGTGTWTLQHILAGADAGALTNGAFGQTVALSASGARLVVSVVGPSTVSNGGTLVVYERNATNAWNLQSKLIRPNGDGMLGWNVALNAAGDRIAACEAGPILSGVVDIFVRDAGGVWSLVQTLEPMDSPPSLYRLFGAGVALSDSGDTLAVAATVNSRGAWWSVGAPHAACCSGFGFAFFPCD